MVSLLWSKEQSTPRVCDAKLWPQLYHKLTHLCRIYTVKFSFQKWKKTIKTFKIHFIEDVMNKLIRINLWKNESCVFIVMQNYSSSFNPDYLLLSQKYILFSFFLRHLKWQVIQSLILFYLDIQTPKNDHTPSNLLDWGRWHIYPGNAKRFRDA